MDIKASPIFEVRHGGHSYRIWANGETEGFPDGSMIFNNLNPLLCRVQALVLHEAEEIVEAIEAIKGELKKMKWKEFKEILPYIDVDKIHDDDTVLMESSFSRTFGIPPWLQQEIRAARRKVSPAPQETPSSSEFCSCGNRTA